MNNVKSIYFPAPVADNMVRAILEDRKTVTRRVVRPQPPVKTDDVFLYRVENGIARWGWKYDNALCDRKLHYCPSDILYVLETWQKNPYGIGWPYFYKASPEEFDHAPDKWHPSIHMPREAVRIFLRVTDVRVERLQNITEEQAGKEGCSSGRIEITGGPWGIEDDPEVWDAREAFADLWNRTIKPADRTRYGWEANPWCWVIEFERISREEAEPHASGLYAKAAPAPKPKRSIERMDYRRFASDLRKVADYFKENRPDFPDVIATYEKCAEVIETLLKNKSETEKEI